MAELQSPPPAPAEPIRKLEALLCVDTVACGFSTLTANQTLLPKFFAKRTPYCRAQLKPTVYCGSMVMGRASVRLSVPFLVSVTRLHISPAVRDHPLSNAAWPHACRWRSE